MLGNMTKILGQMQQLQEQLKNLPLRQLPETGRSKLL